MRSKLPIFLCALSLVAGVHGALDTFTLKLVPKLSEFKKYKQTAKLNFKGMELDFSAIAARQIIKVEDSGAFQVKEEVSEMKINGTAAPADSAPPATTTTYSPRGVVIKIDGDHTDDSLMRAANLSVFVMPEKPVQAGDKWEYEFKEDKATGAVAAKATYSLLGDEKIGSIPSWRVKFTIKEADAAGGSTEGTVWLSKEDGSTVKLNAKWINVPMSGAGSISGELSQILIQ